jgi:hypothetical protein
MPARLASATWRRRSTSRRLRSHGVEGGSSTAKATAHTSIDSTSAMASLMVPLGS